MLYPQPRQVLFALIDPALNSVQQSDLYRRGSTTRKPVPHQTYPFQIQHESHHDASKRYTASLAVTGSLPVYQIHAAESERNLQGVSQQLNY